MIRNDSSGTIKHLRYKGFEGMYMTSDAASLLLNKGCMYTGQVARLTDKVIWLEYDHYIMAECAGEEFLRQYYTDFRFSGELVYTTLKNLKSSKEVNKCL